MAQNYEIEIQAQASIYGSKDRTIKVYFSEPQKGADKDTGLLLILAGYGGSATSNIYTKMRQQFADEYNLFTVQCDYFGYEFMQNIPADEITDEMIKETLSNAELDLLRREYDKYVHILNGKIFFQHIKLNESSDDFNDMGLMQMIDNLRALKVVIDIVMENGYTISPDRVYAYGFSHGAYLAYLCNAFCNNLFTGIIDNSSYLIPYYLNHSRDTAIVKDGIRIDQIYTYNANKYIQDEEILNLRYLYRQFKNDARIICFAGDGDFMTSLDDKKAFLSTVDNSTVDVITQKRVDMRCFKSNAHGLEADFIELFKYAYDKYFDQSPKKEKKRRFIEYKDTFFDSSSFHYEVKWEEGIPILYRKKVR